jgi:hypothetical protein
MRKKFCPAYTIPTLVRGSSYYYIKVYAETKAGKKGELQLFKHTFGINRIHSLPDRIKRGDDLCKKILFWLEKGEYYEDFDERLIILEMKLATEKATEIEKPSLVTSIEEVRDEKIAATPRRSSKRSYRSHAKQFLDFLDQKKWIKLKVDEFSRIHARAYTDYWNQVLKIENANTWNTKLTYIKLYFNALIDRELIKENPFIKIKSRRKTKAKRQTIEIRDMVVLSQLTKNHNPWLWVAAQLAFWGCIRQEELARLKFRHFDKKKWCIRMSAEDTKNWKEDIITLPLFLKKHFKTVGFFDQPLKYYVFGTGVRPGLFRIGERKLHKSFLTVINRAIREKLIESAEGISFSSWRRTGINYWSHNLSPRKFKDMCRHGSFDTTEHYLSQNRLIIEVSQTKNDIFI